MKTTASRFLLLVSVFGIGVAFAACKPPTQDTGSTSPTPTPSPSLSADAAWVANGGSEFWLRLGANFKGTIVNIRSAATTCTAGKLSVSVPVTPGATRTFLLDNLGGGAGALACAPGNHPLDLDYQLQGSSSINSQSINANVTNAFSSTDTTLIGVSALRAATTGALRFTATHSSGSTITLSGVRIYVSTNGQPATSNSYLMTCAATVALPASTSPQTFDTCNPVPVGLSSTAQNGVYFTGTVAPSSTEYWQFVPFSYTP